MGWWSWLNGVNHEGETPNPNPDSSVGPGHNPGDPSGVVIEEGPNLEARSLPVFHPSPWDGWPASWSTPDWDMGSRFNELIDVAWACLDVNASVLSSMPAFRHRSGEVLPPTTWMTNPDPLVYSSWEEFVKQLIWDFQLGEAYVVQMAEFSDGYPMRFRVMPPWAIHVEMIGGVREYRFGGPTGTLIPSTEILHIRYKSATTDAHGSGPLEKAGARMLTAGLLAKYLREFATTGGIPLRTIHTEADLTSEEAQDLQTQYLASRTQNAVAPPVFDSGADLKDHQSVSPKDAAMVELAQFTESRIAVLLGVPPFLLGLPAGGDSLTYSNSSNLFDFHHRMRLRSLMTHVMSALSYWALPTGQKIELNPDEYTRPSFDQRADAWKKLIEAGVVVPAQVQKAERFQGEVAMTALTGGEE